MSCCGKTTFAKQIGHEYYCFDALFPWHEIETFGLSTANCLRGISDSCVADRYVLDGWHTSDSIGQFLPKDCTVYCLFADYDFIINQYRVPVKSHDTHMPMFRKWYSIDYCQFPKVRYWRNDGTFTEVDEGTFRLFRNHHVYKI